MWRTFKDVSRANTKGVFFAVTALAYLEPSTSMADSSWHYQKAYVSKHPSEVLVPVGPVVGVACVHASGAQILGGYAAPGDLLDPVTDSICNRRRNSLSE